METPTIKLLILTTILLVGFSSFAHTEVIQGAQPGYASFLGKTGALNTKIPPTDIVRQLFRSLNVVIPVEPILNFEGVDVLEANFTVPDANGDVSPDHYIQVSNGPGGAAIFKIFNKEGVLLTGPLSMNTFWASFGINGTGNPIVLWDQGASRWLITETGESNLLLLAVSETNDPLGDWLAYKFQTPELPRSPKYGIWPDAYYVTTIENNSADIPIYALDRQAILNGEPMADMQRVGLPKFAATNAFAYQNASPVDWDGASSPPPAGSPQYVLRMYDDAWDGGQDKLEVWTIDIDWTNSDNTTVSGPLDLITEAFDSDVCDGNYYNCIPQSDGSKVAAMMQTLMHRVNYRNFGDHEVMVLNHVVNVGVNGNNLAGIRWYELRKLYGGGQWEIYQQGTLSPDNNHRFIGSIAVDAAGDIGLAYSIMGPDKNLSLAFTGRRLEDPLHQMTIDEYEFATGLSLHSGFRWGDYSMMAVDEEDGATFWFTGPYMKENALWGTRIMSFKLRVDSIDIGPTKILTPVSSAYLTSSQSVEVRFKNFGLTTVSDFKLGLIVDGVFITEESFLDSLAPDSLGKIVFNTTVDMTEIKDYDFKIYSRITDDDNPFNDTLRSVITKFTRFDAAVSDFINIESVVCDTTHNIGIVITNHGAEILNSLTVQWACNNGPVSSYNWTGNLESGLSDTLFVLLDPVLSGINTMTASTIDPNGMADEDLTNDVLERNFEVITDGKPIFLDLLTDAYPYETSWTLMNDNGIIVAEGGPYLGFPEYSEINEQWCLPDGCYTFTIFDSFGDGMVDSASYYSITDEVGHTMAVLSNNDFGSQESKEFCSPFVCSLGGEPTLVTESHLNAFDGMISLNPVNGFPPFQYSIDGGNTFQESSVFSGLGGGVYNIVILDANDCSVEQEVTLETCTLLFSVVVTNATTNILDGSIQINPINGVPPLSFSIDGGDTFQEESLFIKLGAGTYQILVTDDIGCSYSLEVTINSMILGLQDSFNAPTIEVLPNPTDGIFTLNIAGLQNANNLNVDILNVLGQVVEKGTLSKIDELLTGELSLSTFPTGVYFVRFKHQDIHQLVKVVRK